MREVTVRVADIHKLVGPFIKQSATELEINKTIAIYLKAEFQKYGITFMDQEGLYPVGKNSVRKIKSSGGYPVIQIRQWTD